MQLAWSADGQVLAAMPRRCRSIVLWSAGSLETYSLEICGKVELRPPHFPSPQTSQIIYSPTPASPPHRPLSQGA